MMVPTDAEERRMMTALAAIAAFALFSTCCLGGLAVELVNLFWN